MADTEQYILAAQIILHAPDEYKAIAKWLRSRAAVIVKDKGNYEKSAQLGYYVKDKNGHS